MKTFILARPKAVAFKFGGVEHSEEIASIAVSALVGDPDEVELAARQALARTGTHEDGSPIDLAELDTLDVSSGLRDAYLSALRRARQKVGEEFSTLAERPTR